MSDLFHDTGPEPQVGQQKVMLATTAYDSPDASYTFSISQSREALHKAGIGSSYLLLSGDCHVDDARNSVVREFLASDCTDLMFLDADVSWQPADLVKVCQYDRDFVGGVYPYRAPGRDDMPCRTMLDGAEIDADGLLEMEGIPTGFMRMRRVVLERLLADAPSYRMGGAGKMLPILFERGVVPGIARMGGDLHFCWKWRQTGGRIYADPEIRLGHTAKVIIADSLGASLRRMSGKTLRHVCERIRAGTAKPSDYVEAVDAVGNKFGAPPEVLATAAMMAAKAGGHVIEAGSGLSTILMAAAIPGHYVYCLEHDPIYAAQLRQMSREAGIKNIGLCEVPMKDGWYDLSDCDLPPMFAMGLLDGPPRVYGTRARFLDVFGNRCGAIIVDDADSPDYLAKVLDWCRANGRDIDLHQGRLAVLGASKMSVAA